MKKFNITYYLDGKQSKYGNETDLFDYEVIEILTDNIIFKNFTEESLNKHLDTLKSYQMYGSGCMQIKISVCN